MGMFYYFFTEYELFFTYFIISIFSFCSSAYIFIHGNNKKLHKDYTTKQRIFLIISGIIISILYAFLIAVADIDELAQISSFLLTALTLTIINKQEKTFSLITAFISESIAHILKMVSTIIVGTVGWLLNQQPRSILIYTAIGLITFLLSFALLKIKRFKKGFQFFNNPDNLGIGLMISGLVFIGTSIDYDKDYISFLVKTIFIIGLIILGFGLYLWIKKSITKHYREKLQLKSEIYYKEQLEQKEQDIERLNQSNEFLAKIVHRDNHLMSSLDSSINAYFESNDIDFKDDVLREILTLSKERGELISNEQRDLKILQSTGNTLIDGAINEFYIKAAAHGIDFNLTVSATVDEVIGKYISQTDLQTLICDHIKDAIIAVDAKNENNGKILVELSMENDNYTITIFDSGVDFEIDTLAKLGKERVTTHADNGGSGIGFMTTFETLRKSYASLIITEFENKTPFSKSVSIRFDGNTAFIIQSYRKEELQSVLTRDDVILL